MANWDSQEKAGGAGWDYNDANLEYNSEFDPDGDNPVRYNGVGKVAIISNKEKN
jgi:hypothetical protein